MRLHRRWIVPVLLVSGLGLGQLWSNAVVSATSISYYVDCNAGNDTHVGTAPNTAWRSLTKASQAPLLPGDSLLLKRGCTWSGPLNLSQNGAVGQPIYVGAYGTGALPIIKSNTSGIDVVVVTGSYIVLDRLLAEGIAPKTDPKCSNNPVGNITGFRFASPASFDILENSQATGLSAAVDIENGA